MTERDGQDGPVPVGESGRPVDLSDRARGLQHLGLTLGAITGRLIAASVAGQQPEIDLTPYRADRFARIL